MCGNKGGSSHLAGGAVVERLSNQIRDRTSEPTSEPTTARLPSVCGLNEGDNEAFGERKRTSDGVMMAIPTRIFKGFVGKAVLPVFNQRFNVRILVVYLCTVHNNNMCVI